MFIEVTEVIKGDSAVDEDRNKSLSINVRYIGAIFEQDGQTCLVMDKAILTDNVTIVVESKEEIKRRIDASMYGEMLDPAPIV